MVAAAKATQAAKTSGGSGKKKSTAPAKALEHEGAPRRRTKKPADPIVTAGPKIRRRPAKAAEPKIETIRIAPPPLVFVVSIVVSVGLGFALGLLASSSLFGKKLQAGDVVSQPALMEPAQPPQQIVRPAQPELPEDLLVSMGKTGASPERTINVFADPNCSACKSLESALEGMNDIAVNIIPVAILDGSDRMLAGISCASDKVSAWKAAINHGVSQPANCESGQTAGARARTFFQGFGFDRTPTVVAGDGRIWVGNFGGDPKEIRAWLLQKE